MEIFRLGRSVGMAERCVIFGAGEFDRELVGLRPDDFIIAADGGYRFTSQMGLKPGLVIGDFDSLDGPPHGENVEIHPVRKDDTDLALAVRRALDLGFKSFIIHGALGRRTDHSFAAVHIARCGGQALLMGKPFSMCVIKNSSLGFSGEFNGLISIFALEKSKGVSIRGLDYEADGVALDIDRPMGVSNAFTGRPARVSVEDGLLLVMWEPCGSLVPEIQNL